MRWNFSDRDRVNIAVRLFSEVSFVRNLGILVPIRRENALASRAVKGKAESPNATEQIDETKFPGCSPSCRLDRAVLLPARLRAWMCDACSRVHSFAKFSRGQAQTLGEPRNVLDSGISESALDVTDVCGIKAGVFRELFLS